MCFDSHVLYWMSTVGKVVMKRKSWIFSVCKTYALHVVDTSQVGERKWIWPGELSLLSLALYWEPSHAMPGPVDTVVVPLSFNCGVYWSLTSVNSQCSVEPVSGNTTWSTFSRVWGSLALFHVKTVFSPVNHTTLKGLQRELNPWPLAPKARIIPLDHRASCSSGRFRSYDLWVMSPARFHCATLL